MLAVWRADEEIKEKDVCCVYSTCVPMFVYCVLVCPCLCVCVLCASVCVCALCASVLMFVCMCIVC